MLSELTADGFNGYEGSEGRSVRWLLRFLTEMVGSSHVTVEDSSLKTFGVKKVTCCMRGR